MFDYVQQHSLRDFGLTLRVDKCAVWLPGETLEAAGEEQQQRMRDACAARQLRIDSTMESLGVLFGRESEVASFCEAAVDDCEFFFRALEHRDLPLQHASLLLRACQLPRLGYVARHTRTSWLLLLSGSTSARSIAGCASTASLMKT